MTLTIERRDYSANPIFELRDVLTIRSDGQQLFCTQWMVTDAAFVVTTWPIPLPSIAELTLTE